MYSTLQNKLENTFVFNQMATQCLLLLIWHTIMIGKLIENAINALYNQTKSCIAYLYRSLLKLNITNIIFTDSILFGRPLCDL